MKLIFCKACGDIRKLFIGLTMTCYCGKSSGAYEDGLNAWHDGPSLMLGIANNSFGEAFLKNRRHPPENPGDEGYRFDAFFIPEVAPTVSRKELDTEPPRV